MHWPVVSTQVKTSDVSVDGLKEFAEAPDWIQIDWEIYVKYERYNDYIFVNFHEIFH